MPINLLKERMFEDNSWMHLNILVNPVNSVGVMGKGLAKEFKERFPNDMHRYVNACKTGWMQEGKVLFCYREDTDIRKSIAFIATKNHWRDVSKERCIKYALSTLKICANDMDVSVGLKPSIGLPLIGAGLGGIKPEKVRTMIINEFEDYKGIVNIYEGLF